MKPSCLQWPGCLEAVKPPNAGLRLFGGAAFERCLNEFQVAANMLAFPSGAWQPATDAQRTRLLRAFSSVTSALQDSPGTTVLAFMGST
jgi:hypothetical protein